jgi:hypothetical protein
VKYTPRRPICCSKPLAVSIEDEVHVVASPVSSCAVPLGHDVHERVGLARDGNSFDLNVIGARQHAVRLSRTSLKCGMFDTATASCAP